MFRSKPVSPLESWPRTKKLKGQNAYRIMADHFTPDREKAVDMCTGICSLGSGIFIYWARYMIPVSFYEGIIMWLVWTGIFYVFLRVNLKKTSVVDITPDEIRIRRLLRFKPYDRAEEHRFYDEIDDRAEREEWEYKIKYRDAKRPPKRYYQESYYVILEHAYTRVDISCVYGKRKKKDFVDRLHYIARRVNENERGEGIESDSHDNRPPVD